MKIVALAVIIALLLSSSAFAGGNTVSQSNRQTASGTGTVIEQSAVNIGVAVGEGNTLIQNNDEIASVDNDGRADARGIGKTGDSGFIGTEAGAGTIFQLSDILIRQAQANLGLQIGINNLMTQKNKARADVDNNAVANAVAKAKNVENVETHQAASDVASAISDAELGFIAVAQKQANLGLQLGNKNTMTQKNHADAEIANIAEARASGKAKNGIDVDFEGDSDGTADQSAVAGTLATSIAVLIDAGVTQKQDNLGVQVGDKNDMKQKNKADAEIENMAVAEAKATAENAVDVDQIATETANGQNAQADASNKAKIDQTARAGAAATTTAELNHVIIEQSQTNLGIQVGDKNDMVQKNKADVEIENVAVAEAMATAENVVDVDQTAGATADGRKAEADASNKANIAQESIVTTAVDATAKLNQVMVEQSQANLGIQAGNKNSMEQNNKADAEDENAAIGNSKTAAENTADVDQNAIAAAIGRNEVADVSNKANIDETALADTAATTTAKLNHVAIEQSQTNLGIQVGDKNDMEQNNKADAEVENEALGRAKALPSNDQDITDNGKSIVLDTEDVRASGKAKLNHMAITQNQRNIGVQVGDVNYMVQRNKAQAEIEQRCSNDLCRLTDISLDQTESNLGAQIGTMGFTQWNRINEEPMRSDIHISTAQTNALVEVYYPEP
ncbi:MAG: hypothetical protein ACE14P_11980 [Methanotrichaceae archaeon]